MHEHGYAITTPAPGRFCFWRPDGTPIALAPATSGHDKLHLLDPRLHEAPVITDETTTPEWWGDPMHVADVVDGLLLMRDRASRTAARTDAGGTGGPSGGGDVPAGTPNPPHDPWQWSPTRTVQSPAADQVPQPASPADVPAGTPPTSSRDPWHQPHRDCANPHVA